MVDCRVVVQLNQYLGARFSQVVALVSRNIVVCTEAALSIHRVDWQGEVSCRYQSKFLCTVLHHLPKPYNVANFYPPQVIDSFAIYNPFSSDTCCLAETGNRSVSADVLRQWHHLTN